VSLGGCKGRLAIHGQPTDCASADTPTHSHSRAWISVRPTMQPDLAVMSSQRLQRPVAAASLQPALSELFAELGGMHCPLCAAPTRQSTWSCRQPQRRACHRNLQEWFPGDKMVTQQPCGSACQQLSEARPHSMCCGSGQLQRSSVQPGRSNKAPHSFHFLATVKSRRHACVPCWHMRSGCE
jgi:hypothetical protein